VNSKKPTIYIVIFTCIFFHSIDAKIYKLVDEKNGTTKEVIAKNILDLTIFLEKSKKGGSYEEKEVKKGERPAATRNLRKAILNKEAIITSSPLIRALISSLTYSKKNKSTKKALNNLVSGDWSIYQTKNKSFGIFVPKKTYMDLDLESIGLEEKNLNKTKLTNISQNKRIPLLEKKFTGETVGPISIETFASIFSMSQKAKLVKKRIYLIGHGHYSKIDYYHKKPSSYPKGALVAQLDHNQYNKFIGLLTKITCEFLYIDACFSSGWNQIIMNMIQDKANTKIFKERHIPFPIVTTSGPDETAIVFSKINFNTFFTRLHEFIDTTLKEMGGWLEWLKQKPWLHLKPFKYILKPITDDNPYRISSIRLPGTNFFRAVPVTDTTEVITYPRLIKYEIEQFNKNKKQKITYPIKPETKLILIYPSIINLPIKIENFSTSKPTIFSIIPGNSHHFFKEITFLSDRQINLKKILENIGFPSDTATSKLYFFEKLSINRNIMKVKKIKEEEEEEEEDNDDDLSDDDLSDDEDDDFYDYEKHYLFQYPLQANKTVELTNVAIRKHPQFKHLFKYDSTEYICQHKGIYYYKEKKQDKDNENLPNKFYPIDASQALKKIREWIKETTSARIALKKSTIVETEKKFLKTIERNLKKKIYIPEKNTVGRKRWILTQLDIKGKALFDFIESISKRYDSVIKEKGDKLEYIKYLLPPINNLIKKMKTVTKETSIYINKKTKMKPEEEKTISTIVQTIVQLLTILNYRLDILNKAKSWDDLEKPWEKLSKSQAAQVKKIEVTWDNFHKKIPEGYFQFSGIVELLFDSVYLKLKYPEAPIISIKTESL